MMMAQRGLVKLMILGILGVVALLSCVAQQRGVPGKVIDEAWRADRAPSSFPAADEDYFHDMDGGIALSREKVQGRRNGTPNATMRTRVTISPVI